MKHTQVSTGKLIKQKKRYEIEDQLNEIKHENKIREKRKERNKQSLQEIWDYVKRTNLCLIGVPESDRANGTKVKNILKDINQKNFLKSARQANTEIQDIQRTLQRYFSRKAAPRHIIIRFTKVENMEKMLRAAREKGQVTHKGKPNRLTEDLCRNPKSHKIIGANIQHS